MTQPLSKFGSITFATILLAFSILLVLHKPLPPGLCEKSTVDRVVIHLFEPILRAFYYYPANYIFTTPANQIWWTRYSLGLLAKTMGPVTLFERHLVRVTDATWNGVHVRTYEPRLVENSTDGAVIFIHGGGFAIGSVAIMNTFVVSIDYRLSPETVFPENLLDCEKAIDYFLENSLEKFKIDPKKVILVGDSAGGNLATAIAQRRAEKGAEPKLLAQVLLYPLLQLVDLQMTSYRYFHKRLTGIAFVDPASVAFYYMLYAGIPLEKAKELVPIVLTNGHVKPDYREKIDKLLTYRTTIESTHTYNTTKIPKRWEIVENSEAQNLLEKVIFDPNFSPIMRENLENLPKSLIVTCEYDVLRDEGLIYSERLMASGVPTKLINYKNGYHAMLNMHNEITEASTCLDDVMHWILEQF
ncbi:Alpha/beta hydrolase fold-3 domain-containing protein [Caenorhabditis elegans]|uniref:Alpha/beta hydrolase fold-3 domain-containing protein n=1 Tax=Caenorhabditis elegans TaxID=6239 RepID=F0IWV1_CAEEL|nr:Alpha/beta hydrolase fold-3 domain-containing protein [Caenorhabditis elegans]CBZ42131.1 Alpha/beta hydrolase fold-3 domain-containing protein [Caenorhabditis elegans]|eukprot:NP_001256853.1 Neutral Cholesterol Ester Hydrolase homolog [Caenorhabditis elegans]